MLLKDYIPNVNKKFRNIFFSGISFDSKSVKKNNIFFAITGNHNDGNKFIPLAIKKGAKIIISSDKKVLKEIKNKDIVKIYTADVRRTYISECCRIFKNPSKKLDICGKF